jgi:hypothetical protein
MIIKEMSGKKVRMIDLILFDCRFIGISNSQPKSSGIKMVDAWMLVSLVQPLVDVLLQTYSNILSHRILSSKPGVNTKEEKILKQKDLQLSASKGQWMETGTTLTKDR